MRTFATLTALALSLTLTTATLAQQPEQPKPGPEHELLKKHEGTWDTVMKAGGTDFKGVTVNKMELGGLWLVGSLEIDMGGQKFQGRSMDTYDAKSKKFVGVWADSMGTQPMHMEGTYDAKTKTLTTVSTAEMPGPDGKPAKWKSVTTMPNDDTIEMGMWVGDAKEPMFTVTYKRKK